MPVIISYEAYVISEEDVKCFRNHYRYSFSFGYYEEVVAGFRFRWSYHNPQNAEILHRKAWVIEQAKKGFNESCKYLQTTGGL